MEIPEIKKYIEYLLNIIYTFLVRLTLTMHKTCPRNLWILYTHREIFSKSYKIKPKSDCIYHFPIDLGTKRTSVYGSKSIGAW